MENKELEEFADRHKNKTTSQIFERIYADYEKEGKYKPNDLFFLEILKHSDLENGDKENFLPRAEKLLNQIIMKSDAIDLKLKNHLLKVQRGLKY